MSSRRLFALILFLAALAAVTWSKHHTGSGGSTHAGETRTATVERVVDGDTIVVSVGGREERVRYIGMDTPEDVKPGTPVQCYALKAAALNRSLVEGRTVLLVSDREAKDRYGRTLAYVYREPDRLFVNAELVRLGAARTLEISPDTEHAGQFSALAETARVNGRGLWSAC